MQASVTFQHIFDWKPKKKYIFAEFQIKNALSAPHTSKQYYWRDADKIECNKFNSKSTFNSLKI